MSERSEAYVLIKELERGNYYAVCPCCGEEINLGEAGLFYLDEFTPEGEELFKEWKLELREREKELHEKRKKISERSQRGAESINIGFILERLAPVMPGFKFHHNDCRSLFDPIDYIAFEGLSKGGNVSKIAFIDIKTGEARLAKNQREIKNLVEDKKVEWETYSGSRQ